MEIIRRLTKQEWDELYPFVREWEEAAVAAREAEARMQRALRLLEPRMRESGVSLQRHDKAIVREYSEVDEEVYGDGFARDTQDE